MTMLTMRTMSSTTTTAPTFSASIFSAASPIVPEGSTVKTSFTMSSATVAIELRAIATQQSGQPPVLEDAAAGLALGQ